MSSPLSAYDIHDVAGPLLVGYLLNWGLYGILSMQVYVYYLAFPRDPKIHKALAYGTYLLDSAQIFLLTKSAFRSFATGFGNLHKLDEIDLLWLSVPIISGLVAIIVQAFYATRIHVLSKNNYLPALITLLSLLQLGLSIAMGVQVKQASFFSKLRANTFIVTGIWEGSTVACNMIIAACLMFYLLRQDAKLKQNHPATRSIRLTVETGVLTAVVATLTLIITFLPGRLMYYQASIIILGKLYSNSIMVMFNSRMKIGISNAGATQEIAISALEASLSRPDMRA